MIWTRICEGGCMRSQQQLAGQDQAGCEGELSLRQAHHQPEHMSGSRQGALTSTSADCGAYGAGDR